jgi:pyrroline-5-carboxylate reductase
MMIKKIGFIGTGSITEAVVTGLAQGAGSMPEVWLSPRNAEVAARLKQQFSFVRVGSDNQDVADNCDVLCLAVLPQVAKEVLTAIRFRPAHHILSFIATLNHTHLGELVPGVSKITRLAPLPMVAQLSGPTIIFPTDDIARELFAPLGEAICVESEVEFDALFGATALMASYFSMLENYAQWLVSKDVPYESAKDFLGTFYQGLTGIARGSSESFAALAAACSTKGGLNEQVASDLAREGFPDMSRRAIERVYQRIRNS